MAQYLRDEHLTNLTLTEERLAQLHSVFEARRNSMPEQVQNANAQEPSVFLFYVIRFDNKGYRVFSLNELISYFRQADYVERVVFCLESANSLRTGRNVGSFMELRLDNREPMNSFVQVSADDGDWVESSFAAVKEVLRRCGNRSGWIRGPWAQLAIQLGGVFIGFLISLWAALTVAPAVPIDNAFFIVFLFALLVFSNLWVYLNQRILVLVNATFPHVRFYRPDRDRLHWLMQALVGGLVVAVVLFLLNLLFGYIGRMLGEVLPNSA